MIVLSVRSELFIPKTLLMVGWAAPVLLGNLVVAAWNLRPLAAGAVVALLVLVVVPYVRPSLTDRRGRRARCSPPWRGPAVPAMPWPSTPGTSDTSWTGTRGSCPVSPLQPDGQTMPGAVVFRQRAWPRPGASGWCGRPSSRPLPPRPVPVTGAGRSTTSAAGTPCVACRPARGDDHAPGDVGGHPGPAMGRGGAPVAPAPGGGRRGPAARLSGPVVVHEPAGLPGHRHRGQDGHARGDGPPRGRPRPRRWATGRRAGIPAASLHGLYYTFQVGDHYLNVTTLPMVYAALPLYELGGYRLALLVPMAGRRARARSRPGRWRGAASGCPRRGWAAFWIVGLASPGDHLRPRPVGAQPRPGPHGLGRGGRCSTPSGCARPGGGACWPGLAFGVAASMRTEAFVYGFVATAVVCVWLLVARRDWCGARAGASARPAAVGFGGCLRGQRPARDGRALGSTIRPSRAAGTAQAGGSARWAAGSARR